MRIGVLGTGTVGRTIATKLIELGHEVRMGAREADNPVAAEWAGLHHLSTASTGTFADAAAFGEFAFNCTAGVGSVAAVTSAAEALGGKLLIDVANPLDFSGEAPSLFVGLTDSLAEQIQRALPGTHVVKALNTMTASVMVDPTLVTGDHVAFVCGDDDSAKGRTAVLLEQMGWPAARVIDVGDLTGARATEGYLLLWLRMMGAVGGATFNIAIQPAR